MLARMDFINGGLPESDDASAILLSTTTVDYLGARVGDMVLVSARTGEGQINTASFLLAGVFEETSLFGYAPYVLRSSLNRLKNTPDAEVNEIGLFLAD